MIPRLGENARHDVRYRLRPGAYAILLRGREVLLTHQMDPIPEFQLPGGGVDPGESPVVSLHREVMEETGWRIGQVRRLGAYRRFTYMPDYDLWAEKLCHIYLARPALRRGAPTEAGHNAVWAPIETATRVVASVGDRRFLSSILRRRT